MVRNERGTLTYMREKINFIARDNCQAGINFAGGMEQKLEKILSRQHNKKDDDLER